MIAREYIASKLEDLKKRMKDDPQCSHDVPYLDRMVDDNVIDALVDDEYYMDIISEITEEHLRLGIEQEMFNMDEDDAERRRAQS